MKAPVLLTKHNIDIRVLGITNSRTMLLSNGMTPINLTTWQDSLMSHGTDASLGVLTAHLNNTASLPAAHKVIIDTTASELIPRHYKTWLEQEIHVVTPNKRLNAGPLDQLQAVKAVVADGKAHYFSEGTVGAGLPIISTLNTLLDTGDHIKHIRGVFSGTLSFIFNSFSSERQFSHVVKEAKDKGYTEPDPRDDLSGSDVARKILTLARMCGSTLELGDVVIENLVPTELQQGSGSGQEFNNLPDEFMSKMPDSMDALMGEKVMKAEREGMVLRYVGSYDAETGECKAGLQSFPASHAFAGLRGTENIISFTTERYNDSALIIRGPGAGAEVTAAGVFGDLVELGRCLRD
jgi:homoserine dehydrogenase